MRCFELDTKLALIYNQATLIKMSETYRSHASTPAIQGPGVSEQLVLMDKIAVIYLDLLRRNTETLSTGE